jgi:hypothetical protein
VILKDFVFEHFRETDLLNGRLRSRRAGLGSVVEEQTEERQPYLLPEAGRLGFARRRICR